MEARCLVDTGCSRTIISERVAEACRSEIQSSQLFVEGKRCEIAWVTVKVRAKACGHILIEAIVSDSLISRAKTGDNKPVDMILGHDYMQNQRMVVYMDENEKARAVKCRAPLKKSTNKDVTDVQHALKNSDSRILAFARPMAKKPKKKR